MSKPTIATVWLNGCSGCHMSFLDMDERILDLLARVDLVYSPLVDRKEFPEMVDVTIIEGSVGSDENLHKIRLVRSRTKTLVALGDCAITGNVPAMRNAFRSEEILDRAYVENVTISAGAPTQVIPQLLPREIPVREAVHVDVYIPGCPPSADLIHSVLVDLLEGREPDLHVKFG